MLKQLYNWTMSFSNSPNAIWILGFISFLESSVFPIPPHVLMIPIILAAPQRAFLIATVVSVTSVLGGALGYYIGSQFFDLIAAPLLEFYGKMDGFESFQQRFNEQGQWAVLFAGMSPFPYKVITLTSGATGLNFSTFMVFSLIARSTIFFVIAGLLYMFGEQIRDFIEKRLAFVFTLGLICLIVGFYIVKFL